MALSRKYIMLFGDTRSAVDELEDAAAGRLLKAILQYADDQSETALSGEERFVYRMLLAQFARDDEAYRKRSERSRRHRENVNALSESSDAFARQSDAVDAFDMQYKDKEEDEDKEKDKEEYKDKDRGASSPARQTPDYTPETVSSPTGSTRPSVFTPPTPDQVRSYCLEANLSFDAARFCDYNAARGWMQGNRPITDWKAAARLWASRGDLPSVSGGGRGGKVLEQQQYSQREYTNSYDALDRMMARWANEQAGDSP